MGGFENYNCFNVVKEASRFQETNGIPRYKATQRVPDHAQLLDCLAAFRKPLQLLFNLLAHTLPSELNAIVGEASAIPLGHQYVELVLIVFLTEDLGDVFEMVGISPEAGCRSYVLESPLHSVQRRRTRERGHRDGLPWLGWQPGPAVKEVLAVCSIGYFLDFIDK